MSAIGEERVVVPDPPTVVFEQIVTQAMKVVINICVPGVLFFVTVEVVLGRASMALAAYVACQLLAVAAHLITKQESYRFRAAVLAVYALLVLLLSTLHYGPNIGSGVVIVGAAVWAGMILHVRGAILVAAAVTASIIFVGVGIAAGWLEQPSGASSDVQSLANWVRFTSTVTLTAGGLGWLVRRVLGALESSLDGAREVFFEREVERERRAETEHELERAQRLHALGRLAGGVGHDINNALAVVLFNAEALAETEAPEQRELATEIITAVLTARQTTQQLAALSESASEGDQSVAIDAATAQVLRGLERLFPASVRVTRDLQCEGHIAMSADRYERVLMNLCLNAREAMPEGGELSLTTRRQDDGRVTLTVRDTGAGMTRETREHMFDPFFTTKDEGTGLGLTTVYQLVTSTGGDIAVDTAPGSGATFTVDLPGVEARVTHSTAREPMEGDGRAKRICVVEDDPSVRRVIVRVLRVAGHDVVQAETGDEAIQRVTDEADLDVLLSDAGLPGASVGEVIACFREHHPEGRVMVISGHEEGRVTPEADAWGTFNFLRKPFSSDELLGAIGG